MHIMNDERQWKTRIESFASCSALLSKISKKSTSIACEQELVCKSVMWSVVVCVVPIIKSDIIYESED